MVELARSNRRKLYLVERRQEQGHHVAVVPFKSYFVNARTYVFHSAGMKVALRVLAFGQAYSLERLYGRLVNQKLHSPLLMSDAGMDRLY